MSETKTNTNLEMEDAVMSSEQIKKLREKTIVSYKEEIEYLKVVDEYENLSANIAENRLRRETSEFRLMQMQAQLEAMAEQAEQAGEQQADSSMKKERKLATS